MPCSRHRRRDAPARRARPAGRRGPRVQRLHPAVHHLGKAGDARRRRRPPGPPRRSPSPCRRSKPARRRGRRAPEQGDQAGLVGDGDQRPCDRAECLGHAWNLIGGAASASTAAHAGEQCIDIVGRAVAAPGDDLIRPDEREVGAVKIAQLFFGPVDDRERQAARGSGVAKLAASGARGPRRSKVNAKPSVS